MVDEEIFKGDAAPGNHQKKPVCEAKPQVVHDRHPLCRLTHGAIAIARQDSKATIGVFHHIVPKQHVLHNRPLSCPVLVAGSQEKGWSAPVVLEQVSLDQHALGVLQLQQVLQGPLDSGEGRIARPPFQGLEEMVAPDLDVRWHQVADLGIRASEHDVLGGGFKVVVDDLERTRTVVAKNGLRVVPRRVDLGDM